MSSTTALPMMTAIRAALSGSKYASDPTNEFLTGLHDAGYEIVRREAAKCVTRDADLPTIAEMRGLYEMSCGGAASVERVA
jgi:hypothetical protein